VGNVAEFLAKELKTMNLEELTQLVEAQQKLISQLQQQTKDQDRRITLVESRLLEHETMLASMQAQIVTLDPMQVSLVPWEEQGLA
jgi:septal ring factor EnvC (AmiA/AmiB activator)